MTKLNLLQTVNKGILLLALGDSLFAKAAYNLALSLKFSQPDIKIAIVKEGISINHLSEDQKKIFDQIIECPPEYYTGSYIRAKMFLYELSPFDQTLFLDADMLWSPYQSLQTFIDSFTEKLQLATRSEITEGKGFSEWCDVKQVMIDFKIDYYYDLSSEVIWFQKCREVKKVFKDSQKAYDSKTLVTKKFAGLKPDEPAFAIGIAKNKIKMRCPFKPTYWAHAESKKFLSQKEIFQYPAMSVGGNWNQDNIKQIYNNTAKWYAMKQGVKISYPLLDKKDHLKERSLI